jgi:hypothetical protein
MTAGPIPRYEAAMRAAVVAALSLCACKSNPSPLDHAFGSGAASSSDPWAEALGAHRDSDTSGDSGGGLGFDLQGVLERIKDSIDTPGPYESPKQSKDFDAAQPHWGVMGIAGDVLEREAFSLTGGGRGTELRTLANRLRALAKDDQLQGLLLRVEPLQISLPDLVELRAAMHDFRAAGKKLACHTESATNATYLVLAACDRIGLAPLGDIAITGPSAMPVRSSTAAIRRWSTSSRRSASSMPRRSRR